MNILFKCDQSNFIGLGHYYRCLALANEFKKNKHKCFFLGLKPGIVKKNKISKDNEKRDLIFTKNFIKKNKINILIKDIYSLGSDWEYKISKKTFLVVVDDYNNVKHFCHIYINYHLNWFKKKNFKNLLFNRCKKLIGPKFTILRNFENFKKFNFKKKTIFIYMGGADKNRFMKKLSRFFLDFKFNQFLKIFLLNNNHLKDKSLMKNLIKMKNVKVLKNKIKEFHKYIISSNMVISAAGLTMLEQISLNARSLIIPQNFIQKKTAIEFYKAKLISFLPNINNLNTSHIFRNLKKETPTKKVINRKGKEIIYKEIMSSFKYKFKK